MPGLGNRGRSWCWRTGRRPHRARMPRRPRGKEGRRRAIRRLPAKKTRWGGGLRALALGLGEGRRGEHPAGERGRQAEAQKRDRSLLSHVGSPSLAGRRAPLGCAEPLPTCQHTVAEYTPSARFAQPWAPRSGLKGGATTWLVKCRGPLAVERQVAVEHAPPLVVDIGVNLRHGPRPPRGRAGR